LGGCGEFGLNANLYGCRGKWLMVDLGAGFPEPDLSGIDLLVPDPVWIKERKRDLVALVLTHAHEDHLGAVAHLWRELGCPVYATPFAAAVLRGKLKEAGLEGLALKTFSPGATLDLAPFRVNALPITHSLPEAQALAIETPRGVVLHTGDWKFDPEPLLGKPTDKGALKRWGDRGVLAMVCDSTNVFVDGRSGPESEVHRNLRPLLAGRRGRILATTFASHLARIETLATIARAEGRALALAGRALWRMVEAGKACGYLEDIGPLLDDRAAADLAPERLLAICSGSQGEPNAALARIARNEHPLRAEAGDLVLFSAKIIPGNERRIYDLHNRFIGRGVEVLTEKDAGVHVSGHPARAELAEMYRLVRPEIAIPVHGEARHLHEHVRFARSLQIGAALAPRDGDLIRLAPDGPAVLDTVPYGRLALRDGELIRLAARPEAAAPNENEAASA
jgi:ribonuclease J